MSIYATLDEFKNHIQLFNLSSDEETVATDKLTAASRLIDDYLKVSNDFFAAVNTPSTKKIPGKGNSFITLPAPLSGSVTIVNPSGGNVPNFDVLDNMRLITLDENENPNVYVIWERVYYSITGIWGYDEIPPQIKEACIQITAHFWRNRDKALRGTIGDIVTDEQFPERDIPRMARRILDEFFQRLGNKPSGGLVLV